MKKLLIIVITSVILAVITTPVQAQSKRTERKAQQMEAYNKAKTAIENKNFILLPDVIGKRTVINKKESFILITGDKGAFQTTIYSGTSLRPLSEIQINTRKNGDIVFRCELEKYDKTKETIFVTLRYGNNIAIAKYEYYNITGKIVPSNEAEYLIYRNLRYNE